MIRTSHLCLPKLLGMLAALVYVLYVVAVPNSPHLISTVNLIFHEAGHTLMPFLGALIQAASGSGLQVLVPLVCAISFWRRGDIYAVGIMLMWMGESCAEVARYAGDAVVMQLELLGGDDAIHDWNFILDTLNLLSWTPYISYGLYALALLLIIYGAALSLRESVTICETVDVV